MGHSVRYFGGPGHQALILGKPGGLKVYRASYSGAMLRLGAGSLATARTITLRKYIIYIYIYTYIYICKYNIYIIGIYIQYI